VVGGGGFVFVWGGGGASCGQASKIGIARIKCAAKGRKGVHFTQKIVVSRGSGAAASGKRKRKDRRSQLASRREVR